MSIEAWLLVSVLTGAIGTGYFVYGKRQSAPVPLIAGIGLCIYPYFFDSLLWILLIGALLIAAPWLIRHES